MLSEIVSSEAELTDGRQKMIEERIRQIRRDIELFPYKERDDNRIEAFRIANLIHAPS